jgi:hypothetical protein
VISISVIRTSVKSSADIYDISPNAINFILVAPIVSLLFCMLFLLYPPTKSITSWMLSENHPVELLTFASAFAAGVVGFRLARQLRRDKERALDFWFYAIFSAGMIFVAMEEIAWGQQFIGFPTPAGCSAINAQGETTIHNIHGLQGHSEMLRFIFGLGGLIGVRLFFVPSFRKIAAPVILLPWFIVIFLHAGLDVYDDLYPVDKEFAYFMNQTSEFVELLIGIAGTLYVILNSRMLGLNTGKGAVYGISCAYALLMAAQAFNST